MRVAVVRHLMICGSCSYVPPLEPRAFGSLLRDTDKLGTEGPIKLAYPPSITEMEPMYQKVVKNVYCCWSTHRLPWSQQALEECGIAKAIDPVSNLRTQYEYQVFIIARHGQFGGVVCTGSCVTLTLSERLSYRVMASGLSPTHMTRCHTRDPMRPR